MENCRAFSAEFHGWSAYTIENSLIRLTAVPDIGGRIMAYDLGPYPYLFVDPDLAGKLFSPQENQGDGSLAAWKNYGGDKTWPAPQGWENDAQWHGPPDPVLDTGRYVLDELLSRDDLAMLRMISPADEKTGVQITRQFSIKRGSSRVWVELSFTNISQRTIRWSIWDVIQLRAERKDAEGVWQYDPNCSVTAPLNPKSRFARGYNVMFGDEENPQWQIDEEQNLFVGRYLWEIGKVGIDSPAGWIAFNQGTEGYAFAELFEFEEGASYPDDGVTIECWTVGAGKVANLDYEQTSIYLMETEVLSPLRTIAPGETTTFRLTWGACRCPGIIVDVNEAGCTAQPLSASVNDGFVRLRGQFGVFDRGELALICKGGDKQVIERLPLGEVDPLMAVLLDRTLPLPPGAEYVELHVTADAGRQFHLLASAVLEK